VAAVFEVGFTELLLIFALALVVLGPERLPRVASQVGRWIGRARALARQFREQLEDESTLEPTGTPPKTRRAGTTAPPAAATPDTRPRDFVPGADDLRHNDTAGNDAADDKPPDERGT
jgi:sec-independent protein translocase protein TatB